jgi:hypothetical protein
MGLGAQFKHAWNAFRDRNQEEQFKAGYSAGGVYSVRPDRVRLAVGNERSIISSIFNRIAVDVAGLEFCHARNDEDGRYQDDIPSRLNDCLTVQANKDQFAQDFRIDLVETLLDKGVVAIVPTDTTVDPTMSNSYDIVTMRAAEVKGWYPDQVRVEVYNDSPDKGYRQQLLLPKSMVAVVVNPFYQVMNEPSSTLQRLIRKLNMLDAVDEVSSSGKLDLIIQLPYVIKSEARRQQAEQRRKDIEFQLKGSQYGIAYTDGTEKVTQLNRAAENNLLTQVEYLTEMLYSQLGLTDTIMNGSANEETMVNYYNRTVEPIARAILEAMRATFLTKTARTQGQDIRFFRDPFKLVPMAEIANIADKFMRNEVASANDLRTAIGWKPSKDPKADKLNNSNMPPAPVLNPDPKPPYPPSDRQPIPSPASNQAPHPAIQKQLTRIGGNSQNGSA